MDLFCSCFNSTSDKHYILINYHSLEKLDNNKVVRMFGEKRNSSRQSLELYFRNKSTILKKFSKSYLFSTKFSDQRVRLWMILLVMK